jgi:hypothetical protein
VTADVLTSALGGAGTVLGVGAPLVLLLLRAFKKIGAEEMYRHIEVLRGVSEELDKAFGALKPAQKTAADPTPIVRGVLKGNGKKAA